MCVFVQVACCIYANECNLMLMYALLHITFIRGAVWEVQLFQHDRRTSHNPCRLVLWILISISWSSICTFGTTFNKVRNSGVTCITNCWENVVNLPIFQVPSCSAFSSTRKRCFSFSSGSKQQPQFSTGVQVLSLSGCCCKIKAAIPWLGTLVSMCSLAKRCALSQCSATTICCATSWMHSPAAVIHGWVSWPKSWHNSSSDSANARTYSM